MEFAEKIRRLLKAHRLSQADLAESLGTNQQQVSRWLESNTPPKSAYLLRLARTLGVTADYLIDDTLDEPPAPDLTEDERHILRLYRSLRRRGVAVEDVEDRLLWIGEPGGKAHQGGVLPTIAVRDESALARRKEAEMRERSGLELEADRQATGPDDVPPVRGK